MIRKPQSRSSSTVLFVVPDLIGHPGGIARYCQHVRRAVLQARQQVTTIALHDAPVAGGEVSDGRYTACGGSRIRFAVHTLFTAMRRRPTLVLVGHVNFSPLAWLAAKLAGSPYVIFLYGTDAWTPLSPARRWAAKRASLCIAISDHTGKLAIQSNGLDEQRLRVLHNCLDPTFASRDEVRETPARQTLLTVARITKFEPFKGQEIVIRAMPALLRRFPSLVYDIVGDGDRRADLEALVQAEGLQESVRFHGRITDEELARRYAEATVFIMPSKVEGFGFVFAEAMSYGIPAVGGNLDATPEVIVDGETGFVVDPDSVTDIQAAVGTLLSDEARRNRMSRAAREHVMRNFTFASFASKLETMLNEAGVRRDRGIS